MSGTVTLSAIGAFDPSDADTLELVSGLDLSKPVDWHRLEAIVTPARVVIQIDVADPDAVVFSATGDKASLNNDDYSVYDGVTFLNVLATDSNEDDFALVTGDLKASGSGTPPYDRVDESENTWDGFPRSLVIYYDHSNETALQDFRNNLPAFSGEGVAAPDFKDFFTLREVGATGNMVSGYEEGDVSGVIGRWEIIDSNAFISDAPGGATATCVAIDRTIVNQDDKEASCTELNNSLKANAKMSDATVKVFASASSPGFDDYTAAYGSLGDLITITDGWDSGGQVKGTLEFDVEGEIDTSGVDNMSQARFFAILWDASEPTPPCIDDFGRLLEDDDCTFVDGLYDYAFWALMYSTGYSVTT